MTGGPAALGADDPDVLAGISEPGVMWLRYDFLTASAYSRPL